MAIEVTPEMRAAVYEADCAAYGHMWDTSNMLGSTDEVLPESVSGLPTTVVRAKDGALMPHLGCQRCSKVWLVFDEPGDNYEDAVARALNRVGGDQTTPDDAFKPRRRPGVLTAKEKEDRAREKLLEGGMTPEKVDEVIRNHRH